MHNEVKYIEVDLITPHEEVDPDHLDELLTLIKLDQTWQKPIVIDVNHKIILDGHHRWNIAKILGIKKIPVIEVDLFDENIFVLPFREEFPVSKDLVIDSGKACRLLPAKTTKHVWGPEKVPISCIVPIINIHLSKLK